MRQVLANQPAASNPNCRGYREGKRPGLQLTNPGRPRPAQHPKSDGTSLFTVSLAEISSRLPRLIEHHLARGCVAHTRGRLHAIGTGPLATNAIGAHFPFSFPSLHAPYSRPLPGIRNLTHHKNPESRRWMDPHVNSAVDKSHRRRGAGRPSRIVSVVSHPGEIRPKTRNPSQRSCSSRLRILASGRRGSVPNPHRIVSAIDARSYLQVR